MKKTSLRAFRFAALTAAIATAIGLLALCPGRSQAEGYLATQPTELDEPALGTLRALCTWADGKDTTVPINVK